jgi:hypothetical protein
MISILKKRIALIAILPLAFYSLFPLIAGYFSIGDRDGPRIYPKAYHSSLYKIGYSFMHDDKPRQEFGLDRPWFYGLSRRKLKLKEFPLEGDLKQNGIWIQHGWLGDDNWFLENQKLDRIGHFRDRSKIKELALLLKEHNIKDIFPHLCPTSSNGNIPEIDKEQTKIFLEEFNDFRVMPWVGGVLNKHVFLDSPIWRENFITSANNLLTSYPKFKGIHINIEPCPTGNQDLILLLEELRKGIPQDRIISIAAYPPPTPLHPYPDVHWDEPYYKQIADRVDQIVVMMYDTAIKDNQAYIQLMAQWSREILDWSKPSSVLLGLPAYEDAGVGYHDPKVENLTHALYGIQMQLSHYETLPLNYKGIAIYSEWEMDDKEWQLLKETFLRYD